MERADFENPLDRFHKSQAIVRSKDTESGRREREGLKLANMRAKPNTGGPSLSSGPKTQEEVAHKKTEKKSKTKKDANKEKAKSISSQPAAAVTTDNNTQSSSTPRSEQKTKLKKVDMSTKPEDILDTFQNRNLAPAECKNLADQVIRRDVQKVADELRGKNKSVGERDDQFEPPQVASDDSSVVETDVRRSSRQNKSKELQRFGDPVKPSIKEISEEDLSGEVLLKATLQEYRRRLTE